MANLTFFENGRPGLRLQDVFAPIAGEVAFSGSGALQTASLTTTLNDGLVITLRYTGSPISAARGDVHLLSIDTADGTVIRYGDPTAPRHEFSYQDLAGFHRGGAAAAAVAMAGDDRIVGSSNDEYLEGYAGDDALAGKAGADTLAGGTGDDTYIVDDPRAIVVEHLGEGVDSVSSTVSFALPAGMEIETLMASGDASVNLTGNSYANLVIGNDGSNLIRGGAGDDTIRGEAGHDVLFGDAGQDVLVAGAGNDALHGGEGNDEIHGGDGNNALFGDEGSDDVRAGSGNDEISGGGGGRSYLPGSPATIACPAMTAPMYWMAEPTTTSSMVAPASIRFAAAPGMTRFPATMGPTSSREGMTTIAFVERQETTLPAAATAKTGSMVEQAGTNCSELAATTRF